MSHSLWQTLLQHLDAPGNREAFQYPGINLGADHEDVGSEVESLQFGFWVFLMSDAILFGLAFATYVTLLPGTAGAPDGRALYDLGSVFVQTLLLLTSSFTFGLASMAMKYRHPTHELVGWLVVTLLLGLAFLFFEGRDFSAMLAAGGLPSRSGFLSGFWGLVPLHGLHVAAGCLWLLAMLGQIARYGVDRDVKLGLLRLALFWHFLDIVWIFIFSVVYLGALA